MYNATKHSLAIVVDESSAVEEFPGRADEIAPSDNEMSEANVISDFAECPLETVTRRRDSSNIFRTSSMTPFLYVR
jgi:hypothetical protein